ncbi:hypothetical protein HA052_11155 [Chromobacterium haemolyticum]|uniref:Uncharacterized protein n=1 Tax=Chromobacterium fluminis TaxID=3044269 RepID=A0ABX0L9G6_9NEIS|nr:hypothetical protein [Chromobacterium haemolyticum]NHR05758.1 hypothetical protein [Chromobacterium haemolyticum]
MQHLELIPDTGAALAAINEAHASGLFNAKQTMQVIVSERDHNHSLNVVTVTISSACPKCGGPRGKPAMQRYCEEGWFYSVHNWTNPCGHVDYYPDVLREARGLMAQRSA